MAGLTVTSNAEFHDVLVNVYELEASRTTLHPYNHLNINNDEAAFKSYSQDVAGQILNHLRSSLLEGEVDLVMDIVCACTDHLLEQYVSEPKGVVGSRTYQEVEHEIIWKVNERVNTHSLDNGALAEAQYELLLTYVKEAGMLLSKTRDITTWYLNKFSRRDMRHIAKIIEQASDWTAALKNHDWKEDTRGRERGTALILEITQECAKFRSFAEESKVWFGIVAMLRSETIIKARDRMQEMQNRLIERASHLTNRI